MQFERAMFRVSKYKRESSPTMLRTQTTIGTLRYGAITFISIRRQAPPITTFRQCLISENSSAAVSSGIKSGGGGAVDISPSTISVELGENCKNKPYCIVNHVCNEFLRQNLVFNKK